MIRDYFRLALTNIFSRKIRSWLTMIGIFIGIAAVVGLISLGQGLQSAVNEQFSIIGADKIIIQAKSAGFGPPGSHSAKQISIEDLETIKKIKGVKNAAGRLLKTGRIEFNDEVRNQFIASEPQDEGVEIVNEFNNYKALYGRLLKKSDKNKAMVGKNFNRDIFSKPVKVGNKININDKKFDVVGILDTIGDPGRDGSIVINEKDFRDLYNLDKEYSVLVAKVDSKDMVNKVTDDIKKELRRKRNQKEGKEDFEVQTPEQLLSSFNSLLNIVQVVLIGIAAISLLVGGIGIMNTMYTSVLERTKEIGIMKAIGAKNKDILLLFLLESGLLGVCGGIIGVLIGIGLSKGVELITTQVFGTNLIKADVNFMIIGGALAFSFFVGIISGVFPAKKAADLTPVDALRYE